MNGIEKIIETILSSAEEKQNGLVSEAKAEAEGIASRYVEIVNKRSEQLKEEGDARAAQAQQRIIANAELEARKSLLQAKQDLIDEAFRQAVTKVRESSEAELVETLAQLAAQSSATGAEELLLNAAAKSAYGDKLVAAANAKLKAAGRPANLTLAAETREIGVGLVLKEGHTEINCIVERLIWDQREALAMEVASQLFAE